MNQAGCHQTPGPGHLESRAPVGEESLGFRVRDTLVALIGFRIHAAEGLRNLEFDGRKG